MNELFRIVNGALRLDTEKVRNYSEFLAEKLEEAGDASAAKRLRKLLEETDHILQPVGATTRQAIPVDEESRFPLVEKVKNLSDPEIPLILSTSKWDTLTEFLSISKSHALIEAEGISSNLALLLYGPPGCGKSRVARHVARELGLDIFIVRLDGVVSSFLGNTAKNIRAVFEFASRTPGILFLDEFDAIAKLRGDEQEHGELKRVVNSFIQNLDGLGSQSIVLAATNHEELLDRAIWRRFSYRMELTLPSSDERFQLWVESLKPLEFSSRDLGLLSDLSDGFSGSDIHEVCIRLHRRRITSQVEPTLDMAFWILRNFASGDQASSKFLSSLHDSEHTEIATALRDRDPKLYSLSAIGDLLGVSKATAYRWARPGEEDDVGS